MIYGRFGNPITVVRWGTLDDVKNLDKRRPDKEDKAAVAAGSYVVCRDADGRESLYHQAFMRADGGSLEIGVALDALAASDGETP